MNQLNRKTWLKKLAIVLAISSLGFFNTIPIVEAQINPHPSIFKEFPYNRASRRTRKRRPKLQLKRQIRKKNTRLKRPSVVRSNRKPSILPTGSEPRYIEFRAPGY
ncbi:MAG: hypothetical protein HC908_02075 [Calothrix sp. SM1_7_51]|nr:hypothetical protein [Calothrix sp. SM1_7_51]